MLGFIKFWLKIGLTVITPIVLLTGAFYIGKQYTNKSLATPQPVVESSYVEQIIPTQIPTTKPNPTVDPDPIIDCKFTYIGTMRLRRTVCSKSTECQIGGKWIYYNSVDKCKADQKASQPANNTNYSYTPVNFYSCTLCFHYPSGDNCITYDTLVETKEKCDAEQAKIDRTSSTYVLPSVSIITPQPTTNPACSQAVAEWNLYATDFKANKMDDYDSSAEAMVAYLAERQEIQNQINSYGCSVVLN